MRHHPRPIAQLCSAAVLALLAGSNAALADDVRSDGLAALLAQHPGVRSYSEDGRVSKLYGSPMSAAASAQDAVDLFLFNHADAFGIGAVEPGSIELSLDHAVELMDGKFTAFQYRQIMQGMPVEYGQLIVLVLNAPSSPRGVFEVVYAGSNMVKPITAVPEQAMNAAQAVQVAAKTIGFRHLTQWSQPTMVVYAHNDGKLQPQVCWKLTGQRGTAVDADYDLMTLFFNVQTGELVHSRREIYHHGSSDPEAVNISGKVTGLATPGTLPDLPSNPPVPFVMQSLQVNHTGGSTALTDKNGDFTIPFAGTGAVTLTTTFSTAQWFAMFNQSTGGIVSGTLNGTAGTGNNILLNPTPSANLTAQTNSFHHANLSRQYIVERAPSFTALNKININANLAQTCNAFYDGSSINFYLAGGGCVNTAYSSVVAHEYGHHMVNRRGLTQGGFGEGFSDTVALMLYDDPVVGKNFFTNGGFIRNPDTANQQYPCSSTAVHTCGQIVGGCWWDIRTGFGAKFGSAPGLELTRDRHVAWYVITGGGAGSNALNSAHPGTAIEVLTVDDDDGNINNGTPNYPQICQAFDNHNIDCPALQLIGFSYPSGKPAQLDPQSPTNFPVVVSGISGTPQPNTGQLFYRVNGGSFIAANMTQGAPNNYTATIPGVPCLSKVDYYVAAMTSTNLTVTDPPNAPASFFTANAFTSITTVFTDDMETNKGWTAGLPGDTATTGQWNRMNPQATAAQPEDDTTPGAGVNCFVTNGNAGTSIGDFDVDNGFTTLLSPAFAATGDAVISYQRWYSNNQGGAPNADTFRVDISNNGGTSWVNAETVGPAGPQAGGGWNAASFTVASKISPSANMRVRFVAEDAGTGSIVEAAVDDFKIEQFECTTPCYADCDGNGTLNVFDYICFGNAYSSSQAYADCDGNGSFNVFDYICYGNAYSAGCP